MSTLQRMLLSMLRNPFLNRFLSPATLRYLIRVLQMDQVDLYVRGVTMRDALFQAADKLHEQWNLVTYARIRFYRDLARDELITKKQLSRLERDAAKVEMAVLGPPVSLDPQPQTHFEPANPLVVDDGRRDDEARRIALLIIYRKPFPLPWERDPEFFKKHPTYHQALQRLRDREREISWYSSLWHAVADGLR